MVKIHDILESMREQFEEADLESAALDARLLMQAALQLPHEALVLGGEHDVTEGQLQQLGEMTARRLAREPVSRILGCRGFWKSDFKISPATLDPRADSETLIEATLDNIADKTTALSILDLGTGTGCLLLTLLQEFTAAHGVGIDVSPDAVKIAAENAKTLDLATRSSFMAIKWGDFYPEAPFDIVISNPPYIKAGDIAGLAEEVKDYDPITALSGGADGLDCYREIAAVLPRLLAKRGLLVFEIGFDQAETVAAVLAGAGLSVLQTLTDLSGHNRCIVARWS